MAVRPHPLTPYPSWWGLVNVAPSVRCGLPFSPFFVIWFAMRTSCSLLGPNRSVKWGASFHSHPDRRCGVFSPGATRRRRSCRRACSPGAGRLHRPARLRDRGSRCDPGGPHAGRLRPGLAVYNDFDINLTPSPFLPIPSLASSNAASAVPRCVVYDTVRDVPSRLRADWRILAVLWPNWGCRGLRGIQPDLAVLLRRYHHRLRLHCAFDRSSLDVNLIGGRTPNRSVVLRRRVPPISKIHAMGFWTPVWYGLLRSGVYLSADSGFIFHAGHGAGELYGQQCCAP